MRTSFVLASILLAASCSDGASGPQGLGGDVHMVGSDQGGTSDGAAADAGQADTANPGDVPDQPPLDAGPDGKDDTGQLPCVPNCAFLACGGDGCGGLCGTCDAGELCSEAGTCDPDPTAGCGGLELAEDWVGTFEGVYDAKVLGGLVPATDGDTDGDLSFSITCLNSKYIVNGEMKGTASGDNPFELTLTGTYNPTTKELKGTIPTGHVVLVDYANLDIEFAGELPGILQADGTFDGTYHVDAVGGSSILGPLDMNQISASSSGTWTAAPAP